MSPWMRTNVRPPRRSASGGGSGSFTPNRPVGLTTVADVTFDATFDNGGFPVGESAYEYPYKGIYVYKFNNDRTTVQPSLGETGQHVLRARAPVGYGAGEVANFYAGHGSESWRHIYYSMMFKVDVNNVFDVTGQKLLYPVGFCDGNTFRTLIAMREVSGGSRFDLALSYVKQWDGSQLVDLFSNQNMSAQTWAKGVWHRLEWEVKLETLGGLPQNADGVTRLWMSVWNGSSFDTPVKVIEYTNLTIDPPATTSKGYGYLAINTYRGGGGTPVLSTPADILFSRCHWSAV